MLATSTNSSIQLEIRKIPLGQEVVTFIAKTLLQTLSLTSFALQYFVSIANHVLLRLM